MAILGMELSTCPDQAAPTHGAFPTPDPEGWTSWLKLLRANHGAMNTPNIWRCIRWRLREYRPDEPWPQCVIDEVAELWGELERIRNNRWMARQKRQETELRRSKRTGQVAKALPKILGLWQSRLPKRPYCTDDFQTGVWIRPQATAVTHREIQPNPPWARQCLVIDIDHDLPLPETVPPPNVLATNPATGHRHAIYLWKTPILVGPNASFKARKYLEDIAIALRIALGGDPNYRGTLCHNPLHPDWITEILSPKPYQLRDFLGVLERIKAEYSLPVRHGHPEGAYAALGRNCATFEACRHPAYALGPRPDLQDRVRALVEEYNLQNNTPPLSTRECQQIAKSIANYVLSGRRQLLIGRTHGSTLQAKRGRASGAARRNQTRDQRTQAVAFYQEGKTQKEIADILSIHQSTVCRWLRFAQIMHEPIQDNSRCNRARQRPPKPAARKTADAYLTKQGWRIQALERISGKMILPGYRKSRLGAQARSQKSIQQVAGLNRPMWFPLKTPLKLSPSGNMTPPKGGVIKGERPLPPVLVRCQHGGLSPQEVHPMSEVTTIGIDLAKNVFELHGGRSMRQAGPAQDRLARQVAARLGESSPLSDRHRGLWWCASLGSRDRQVGARCPHHGTAVVIPYRKSGKNDANDAEAICEAVSRPNMHFVAVKTTEQQSSLLVHRVRESVKEARTASINQIRGLLMEFGIVLPQGKRTDSAVLPENGGATAAAPYRDCLSYEPVYLHPAENGTGLKAGLRTYFAWYNAERRE